MLDNNNSLGLARAGACRLSTDLHYLIICHDLVDDRYRASSKPRKPVLTRVLKEVSYLVLENQRSGGQIITNI